MKKIISISIGVISTILLLEMGLRMLSYFYNRQPKLKTTQNNNLIKIVTVGESTTAVASNDEGTYLVKNTAYPIFLEKYLNSQNKFKKFEVVNKGIMSGDTDKIIAELDNYLKNNRVDLVVAMIGMKDESNVTINSTGYRIKKFLQFSKVYSLISLAYEEWQIYNTDINDNKEVNEFKDLNEQFLKIAKDEVYLNIAKQALSENYDEQRISRMLSDIYLANYFYNTGNLSKAESIYKKLIETEKHGYFSLVDVLLRSDKINEAISLLKNYKAKFPQNEYALKELVNLLIKEKNITEAKKLIKGLGDNSFYFKMAKAKVAFASGDLKQSVKILSEACDVDAFSHLDRSNQKRSIKDHLFFILNKYEYDNCALELSRIYVEVGEYKLAEILLRKYLEVNSNDFAATNMLRQIYKNNNDEEMSLKILKQSAYKNKRLGDYFALMQEMKKKKLSLENEEILKVASEDFFETKLNIKKLYHLTYKHGGRLILVQYPTFDISFLKELASEFKGILFIDNESIFDDRPKVEYIFEPKYPYKFNHYTKRGAEKLAENIGLNILKFYQQGDLR